MPNRPPPYCCQLDGQPITIRPISEADAELEVAFVDRLSPATKHYRFLGGVNHLSAELVKKFCDVDFDQTAALIATTSVDGKECEIGVARYAPGASDDAREIAITVAEEWRHKGLGSLLAQRLIDFAKTCGIRKLYSVDLADNQHMRQLATHLGMNVRDDPDDSTQVIYMLNLDQQQVLQS